MSTCKGELALALALLACPAAVARAAEPGPAGPTLAQPGADNAVYAEVFGSGIVPLSINYARRLGDVSVRAGLGFWSGSESSNVGTSRYSYTSVPLTGAVPIGHGPLRLEVGGGISFVHMAFAGGVGTSAGFPGLRTTDSAAAWLPMVTALVGLRYSPPGAGLTAGLTFTPVLAVVGNAEVIGSDRGTTLAFLPWGGANVGYQF